MQDEWLADARGLDWVNYELSELDPVGKAMIGFGGALGAALTFFGVKTFSVRSAKGSAPVSKANSTPGNTDS